MSILQERLMLVFAETGRVAVTQKALMGRLQERWPTQHGYAAQIVESALKELQAAGTLHCSPAGRWTRFLNLKGPAPTPAAAKPITSEPSIPPRAEGSGDATAAPAQAEPITAEIKTEETEMATKCGKCGGTDFTPAGVCRPCKKEANAAYRAGRGKVVAAKKRPPKAKPAKNGHATPRLEFAPMVRTQYQLVIFDTGGDKHEFMVDLTSIKRLQGELQGIT